MAPDLPRSVTMGERNRLMWAWILVVGLPDMPGEAVVVGLRSTWGERGILGHRTPSTAAVESLRAHEANGPST